MIIRPTAISDFQLLCFFFICPKLVNYFVCCLLFQRTPLHDANVLEIVKLLIESGADVNAKDDHLVSN